MPRSTAGGGPFLFLYLRCVVHRASPADCGTDAYRYLYVGRQGMIFSGPYEASYRCIVTDKVWSGRGAAGLSILQPGHGWIRLRYFVVTLTTDPSIALVWYVAC